MPRTNVKVLKLKRHAALYLYCVQIKFPMRLNIFQFKMYTCIVVEFLFTVWNACFVWTIGINVLRLHFTQHFTKYDCIFATEFLTRNVWYSDAHHYFWTHSDAFSISNKRWLYHIETNTNKRYNGKIWENWYIRYIFMIGYFLNVQTITDKFKVISSAFLTICKQTNKIFSVFPSTIKKNLFQLQN